MLHVDLEGQALNVLDDPSPSHQAEEGNLNFKMKKVGMNFDSE